jgi:hypothetical protein
MKWLYKNLVHLPTLHLTRTFPNSLCRTYGQQSLHWNRGAAAVFKMHLSYSSSSGAKAAKIVTLLTSTATPPHFQQRMPLLQLVLILCPFLTPTPSLFHLFPQRVLPLVPVLMWVALVFACHGWTLEWISRNVALLPFQILFAF